MPATPETSTVVLRLQLPLNPECRSYPLEVTTKIGAEDFSSTDSLEAPLHFLKEWGAVVGWQWTGEFARRAPRLKPARVNYFNLSLSLFQKVRIPMDGGEVLAIQKRVVESGWISVQGAKTISCLGAFCMWLGKVTAFPASEVHSLTFEEGMISRRVDSRAADPIPPADGLLRPFDPSFTVEPDKVAMIMASSQLEKTVVVTGMTRAQEKDLRKSLVVMKSKADRMFDVNEDPKSYTFNRPTPLGDVLRHYERQTAGTNRFLADPVMTTYDELLRVLGP